MLIQILLCQLFVSIKIFIFATIFLPSTIVSIRRCVIIFYLPLAIHLFLFVLLTSLYCCNVSSTKSRTLYFIPIQILMASFLTLFNHNATMNSNHGKTWCIGNVVLQTHTKNFLNGQTYQGEGRSKTGKGSWHMYTYMAPKPKIPRTHNV